MPDISFSDNSSNLSSARFNVCLNFSSSRPRATALFGDPSTLSSLLADVRQHVHFNVYEYAFSGAVAGGFRALSRGLTFPFDTLKTVKQVQRANGQSPLVEQFTAKELFRGVVPAIVSAVPANAVFFVIYNYLLTVAASEPVARLMLADVAPGGGDSTHVSPSILFFERLLFSSIATLPSNLIKTPAELLKQRAQVQPDASLVALVRDATRPPLGIRGLFLGNNAQLLRELPYNAIQMATFDFLRDKVMQGSAGAAGAAAGAYPIALDPATLSAGLGFVAAGFAAALTQPADTVKTRLMAGQEYVRGSGSGSGARSSSSSSSSSIADSRRHGVGDNVRDGDGGGGEDNLVGDESRVPPRTPGILDVTRQILAEEGVEGLFVGMKYRVALVSFGGMIYFSSAELGRQLFDLRAMVH